MTNKMNNEHVSVAAYYLWQKAGCPSGRDLEFWNQAYNELYGSKSMKKCCSKSFSKTATTKSTAKKLTSKPVVAKKSVAKPVLAAKPFYGIKK